MIQATAEACEQRFPLRPTERRVEQDDIEPLLCLREKLQSFLGMNLHLLRQLEHLLMLLQHGDDLSVEFTHHHRFCVAGRAFKTQRAAASKQIQHGKPGQILPEPIEQPFAHAVGRGAQAFDIRKLDFPPAQLAAGDADLVAVLRMNVLFFHNISKCRLLLQRVVLQAGLQ